MLDPDETLADDERYQSAVEALGDDLAPVVYLDLPSRSRSQLAGDTDGSPDYEAIAPYTEALDSLVAGSRVEDGLALTRVTLTAAPE